MSLCRIQDFLNPLFSQFDSHLKSVSFTNVLMCMHFLLLGLRNSPVDLETLLTITLTGTKNLVITTSFCVLFRYNGREFNI